MKIAIFLLLLVLALSPVAIANSAERAPVLRPTAVKKLSNWSEQFLVYKVCAAGSTWKKALKQIKRQADDKRYTGRKRSSRWYCGAGWAHPTIEGQVLVAKYRLRFYYKSGNSGQVKVSIKRVSKVKTG